MKQTVIPMLSVYRENSPKVLALKFDGKEETIKAMKPWLGNAYEGRRPIKESEQLDLPCSEVMYEIRVATSVAFSDWIKPGDYIYSNINVMEHEDKCGLFGRESEKCFNQQYKEEKCP